MSTDLITFPVYSITISPVSISRKQNKPRLWIGDLDKASQYINIRPIKCTFTVRFSKYSVVDNIRTDYILHLVPCDKKNPKGILSVRAGGEYGQVLT